MIFTERKEKGNATAQYNKKNSGQYRFDIMIDRLSISSAQSAKDITNKT